MGERRTSGEADVVACRIGVGAEVNRDGVVHGQDKVAGDRGDREDCAFRLDLGDLVVCTLLGGGGGGK